MNDQEIVDRSVYLACSLLSIIILAVDFITPLGVASGVPYIVVVLMSLKSPEKYFTLIVAVVCTVFVGIGYLGSPPSLSPTYQVIANRGLSIFAIWITALLALIQKVKMDELHRERINHLQSIKELELQEEKLKVLKATMRTVQDIMGNFLNNLQYFKARINKNKTLSPEEINQLNVLIHDASLWLNKMGNTEEVREKKMAGDMIGIDLEYEQVRSNDDTIAK
ncbi:hypothetical protein [Nitrosomonas sp. JL21]|uniref:hypothetical protein n=1 Tax=Nitrosomonas sp. JL21 TaxID=153949 RepID=UPI0031F3869D